MIKKTGHVNFNVITLIWNSYFQTTVRLFVKISLGSAWINFRTLQKSPSPSRRMKKIKFKRIHLLQQTQSRERKVILPIVKERKREKEISSSRFARRSRILDPSAERGSRALISDFVLFRSALLPRRGSRRRKIPQRENVTGSARTFLRLSANIMPCLDCGKFEIYFSIFIFF